jgi:heptosyltransferase III
MSSGGQARSVWRRVLLHALAVAFQAGSGQRHASRKPLARTGTHPGSAPGGVPGADTPATRPLRILLIRPDHLGDLLLATPAFGLLRAALPEARLTALIGPWARPVLDGRAEVDAVQTCAFPGFTREPARSPLAPYWQLLVEALRLRRQRYDAALVLRVDHWWGAALAAAADIPLRLGYGVPESRPFLTHALPPDFAQHSVVENWRVAAALLGLQDHPLPTTTPPPVYAANSPAGRAAADALLAAHGIPPDAQLVALQPGTGADVKRWPAVHWATVADAVARRLDARVVVTGSESERALVAAVVGAMREPAVAAAGVLDWDGLAGLFARCALVLGVDSGPLHLAAALDVPSVAIFGPTAPARFGPWADPRRHRVVREQLPCSPCGNLIAPPCGARTDPPCMQAVSPERVIAAALEATAASPTGGPPGTMGLVVTEREPSAASPRPSVGGPA